MAKVSQKAAGYTDGSPKNLCGYCQMYRGGACSMVEGRISPYKICKKFYKPFKNPRYNQYSIVKRVTPTPTDDWAR
jgi:hypothetical protein